MKRIFFLVTIFQLFSSQVMMSQYSQQKFDSLNFRCAIQWTNELSWQQVKERALKERKYIFVDCYATWCNPCKLMDRNIYTECAVGDYFNKRFISVRLQMDRTNKDNERVKAWYDQAVKFDKEFKIKSYPSYLFFSPSGTIVYKDAGFKNIEMLLTIADSATKVGKTYVDPYFYFDSLINNYNRGIRNYENMPYLIKTARSLKDVRLYEQLSKDYFNYLEKNNVDVWKKDQLEFLASYISTSDNKYFSVFYKEYREVNKKIGKEMFAQHVVDRIIGNEEIKPFIFKITDNGPPEWEKIRNKIKAKYNNKYAARLILKAKINWYEKNYKQVGNSDGYANSYLLLYKKYGIDEIPSALNIPDSMASVYINSFIWRVIFLGKSNKNNTKTALSLMKEIIKRDQDKNEISFSTPARLDTYANLLYKYSLLYGGKALLKDAINFENKALIGMTEYYESKMRLQLYEPYIKNIQDNLDKMNQKKPTWPAINNP